MTKANDLTPFYDAGKAITARAGGALTGKRVVVLTGDPRDDDLPVVELAGAGGDVFAVAAQDRAEGANVLIFRDGVLPITAGGAVSAGDHVKAAANGKVVTAAAGDLACGVAMDDAGNDEDTMVAFYPHIVGQAAGSAIGDLTPLTDNSGGAAGNNTIAVIPDPTDTPASADALRDNLVAAVLPPIRDAVADLAAKVNAIIAAGA